jgi:hypothetical protein
LEIPDICTIYLHLAGMPTLAVLAHRHQVSLAKGLVDALQPGLIGRKRSVDHQQTDHSFWIVLLQSHNFA